jgi:hypothetical protein
MVSIVTLILMAAINYVVSRMIGWNFIDFALFVGLASAIIIRFFTSTGGLSSNMVRMQTQAITGIKVDEEKQTFKPTYAYYAALVYTAASFIGIIIYYREYFL